MIVDALIPALNEEESLPTVLDGLKGRGIRRVVVVDNGSSDHTYQVIERHGGVALYEGQRGYGAACLRGLRWMAADPPDVVVFLDGDGADDPDDLPALLAPIEAGEAEMVIGSRVRGQAEAGALTPQARFGNTLACTLIKWLYGVEFTDLGPFRAVTWSALERMQMADEDFGWTVEMQVKAPRRSIPSAEVPVDYRRRVAGQSKVAGTIKGSFQAGVKILYVIGREVLP
ncbi:MAG: glycosyltransferase family 2 protein [Bradymonadia bacterium]